MVTRLRVLVNRCFAPEQTILRKYFKDDDFRATLEGPAPGIFDQSSWAKWNERYDRTPVPPLPRRKISGVNPATVPDFFPPQVLKTSARFTDCSRHSSPKFLASTFSHSVYHANESQACFLRGVLDWLEGLALQLPPLLTPAALARREVYPVFPSRWRRLASFRSAAWDGLAKNAVRARTASMSLLLSINPERPEGVPVPFGAFPAQSCPLYYMRSVWILRFSRSCCDTRIFVPR